MGEILGSSLFVKKMNFVDSISERTKPNWAEIYKQLTGKKWVPPKSGKQVIKCEAKTESLEEIDKLMKAAPNYSVDVQGRES